MKGVDLTRALKVAALLRGFDAKRFAGGSAST
jgi:hypothetical protein